MELADQRYPLCLLTADMPRRAFTTHVGKHMEQIVLAALPRNVKPDSETRFSSVADLENHPGRSPSQERGNSALGR